MCRKPAITVSRLVLERIGQLIERMTPGPSAMVKRTDPAVTPPRFGTSVVKG